MTLSLVSGKLIVLTGSKQENRIKSSMKKIIFILICSLNSLQAASDAGCAIPMQVSKEINQMTEVLHRQNYDERMKSNKLINELYCQFVATNKSYLYIVLGYVQKYSTEFPNTYLTMKGQIARDISIYSERIREIEKFYPPKDSKNRLR